MTEDTAVPATPKPWRIPRTAVIAWAIALLALGGWMVARGLTSDRRDAVEALPVLYTMPDFELTASDGSTVTGAELRGGRAVVEFIFTECRLFCPVMSIRMGELQAALAGDPSMRDVRLVSISVDPDNDTPEVLAEYADRYHADPDRWSFLTGTDRASVWRLVEQGFKLPVTDESENAAMPIGHSGNWVIFDRGGQARATVSALQGPTVEETLEALRAVGP